MYKRNALSTTGRRSRFLTALAILALIGAVPMVTVGATTNPAGTTAAGAAAGAAAPTQPASGPSNRTNARPTPDQVPLVSVSGPGSGAHLVLSAPTSVAVGQTITIVLKAAGIRNLAGYEGVLRFDPAAAEFDGLRQRSLALAGSRRDVQPLGPVVVPSGVAFGLYSCSIAGCGDSPAKAASHPGASGTVVLAKLTLVPTQAGRLALTLGSIQFVDTAGKTIKVSLPGPIVVKVGAGGKTFAAPATPALRPGLAQATTSADISGDGLVGPADLNTAAIAWGLARESGTGCGQVHDAADVNHDGCLDVQDLQLIAARVAPRRASSLLGPNLMPLTPDTFTVDSTSDAADKTPGDGVCATAATVCSLRAAIAEANLHPGPDTIAFGIPGGGVHTITLGSGLPVINDTTGGLTIDGYTQPGASPNTDPSIDNAVINVQVTSTNPNADALIFSSSNNAIRGLAMYGLRHSMTFQTSSAKSNSVTGSFIGTNSAGTFVAPAFNSGGDGITVTQGASYTMVGGPNPADRNVISGNSSGGFSSDGEQSDHNTVQGNLIGPGPNGQPIHTCFTRCFDQQSRGVHFKTGSSYNLVGGTGLGQRNVISDNAGNGIEMSHGSTNDSNQAIGNYIGTDVTGNAGAANKFGNGLDGIQVEDGSTNSILAYNVVANNAQRTDSGLAVGGIEVLGFYTAGTSVHDNKIGVGADGVTPMPNSYYGVDVHFNASWTTVGPGNIVANNPTGVVISDTSNVDHTLTSNSIYNNGSTGSGRGIQVLNHANNSIAVPTLSPSGVSLTAASGAACAGCTVEAFRAIANVGDASAGAAGQGKTFLGSTLVPASGAFTIGFTTTLSAGDLVTATVTDPAGDTSQFSVNVVATSIPNPTPPPTPAPTPPPSLSTYVSDTFTRTLSATWGAADIGGNYAGFYCTNPDMNVTGTVGTVILPDPHNLGICAKNNTVNTAYRGGYLTNVSAQDVDIRFKVATATLSTSDNINAGFDARRVSGFTSYRGQVRLTPTNQVWLQADTVVNDTTIGLGTNTRALGTTVSASSYIWVRAQVTGTFPTTIKMKAWNVGNPEPVGWTLTVQDSTAVLQAPGAVGLLSWLSPAWNQGPATIRFDDLNVTSPISGTVPAAPVADFTSAQVGGSLDVNFTDTSTAGTPTDWFWDFGDGSTSTAASPTHSYAADGSYEVKLTTTNDGGFSSKTRTVVVNPVAAGTPVAGFTDVQNPGTLDVQFTDTSTNSPTSWSWDFGDGSPVATGQNPLHTYPASGSYGVTLHATNGVGSGTTSKGVTVIPLPLPGATYITLTPSRIVDSRTGRGLPTRLTAHVHQTFHVTGVAPANIPSNAVAVTGNLTVTGQTAAGYFSLGPVANNNPTTSTLNFPLGDNRANGVTVPLGAGGMLSVTYAARAGNTAQVIFDVTGYFMPDTSGSTYFTVKPNRLVDSRTPLGLPTHLVANAPQTFTVVNRSGDITLNVPSGAVAVTGNLTVTKQTAAGYFSLGPVPGDTSTSTLNFPLGDTRANGVTVPLGLGGSLSITYVAVAHKSAEVIFDVTGYFVPDTTGATYVTVNPSRLVDSRSPLGLPTPLVANAGQTFQVTGVAPANIISNASAVTGNLTVTGQTAAGYFSLGPVPGDTSTSTLNFPLGDTRANGVTVPLGGGGKLSVIYVAIAGKTAQVIFDVTGYFVPAP